MGRGAGSGGVEGCGWGEKVGVGGVAAAGRRQWRQVTGGGTRRFAGGTLSHAPAAKQKPRRPAVRGRTCTIALALRRLFYLGERTFFRKWPGRRAGLPLGANVPRQRPSADASSFISPSGAVPPASNLHRGSRAKKRASPAFQQACDPSPAWPVGSRRSEEHTSELQSLIRTPSTVFF